MRKITAKKGFIEALVLTLTVASLLLFVVWQLASAPVVPEAGKLQEQVKFLSEELAAMKIRFERTQAREIVLEKEAQVIRQANRLLQEHESERQAELNQLNSELDFFRRLAGTGGLQSELDVYRAEVIPTDSARVFQFILTLTQNIRRASIITGRVRLDVEGTMDDRPVKLFWAQVSDGETPEPSFRFKYFQQLEGYLTLPEGFSPTRVIVTLEARDKRKPVIRNYDWQEIISKPAD